MKTRDEMVRTLAKFCDDCHGCNICLLEKFSGGVMCDFDEWSDDKLAIAYDHVYKNMDENVPDMVNHPQHYTQGGIECIDALKAATVGKRGIEAVCVANVIKYLWRYEEKNGIEDVRKAKWYIERLLMELEESQQS